MSSPRPNRDGVDAGWAVCLHTGHHRSGATHRARSAASNAEWFEQEATEGTETDSILRYLLVTPAMAGGSNRLKSIDDENCPFNI